LRRSLFKAQFLEQEPVIYHLRTLGSTILYPGQVYHWGSMLDKTSDRRERNVVVHDAVNPGVEDGWGRETYNRKL